MTEKKMKLMEDLMEKIDNNQISPNDINKVTDIIRDLIRMMNSEKEIISTADVSHIREFYRHEGDTGKKEANLNRLINEYRKMLVQIYGRFCGEAVLHNAEELIPLGTDLVKYFMKIDKATGFPMAKSCCLPDGRKVLFCENSRHGKALSIVWIPEKQYLSIGIVGGEGGIVFTPGTDNYREELRFLGDEWIDLAQILDTYCIKGTDPSSSDDQVCEYNAEVGCDLCVYQMPDGRCWKNG